MEGKQRATGARGPRPNIEIVVILPEFAQIAESRFGSRIGQLGPFSFIIVNWGLSFFKICFNHKNWASRWD